MKVAFGDLYSQHRAIEEALLPRLQKLFESSAYIQGQDVAQFEHNFAEYLGVAHVISVANGTDAITIALRALGIEPGDEVLMPVTTFIATASAAIHAGAKPVLVDIDPTTRQLDLGLLRKAITSKTKVIVPVHLYGQPEDMESILALAKEQGLKVLEDASQAHGAEFDGHKVGTFGNAATFSFYPGKNLGAYGDAGAVVTNDVVVAERARMLRDHGGMHKYEHRIVGYNSRLDTIQAIVLDEKLKLLDQWNTARVHVADRYFNLLSDAPKLTVFPTLPRRLAAYHLYIIQLADDINRDQFMARMGERDIGVGVHYPEPLHLVPALEFLGYKRGDFPAAERYCRSIVSLPIHQGMTDEQVDYVASAALEFTA
jgi:dTDP-4-amino-4,6-dideoxygalactose transaminase